VTPGIGRPGLRATVTALVTLGALLLSALMAVGTYLAARNYLVEQRERTALQQAYSNASYVREGLLTSGASVPDVLGTVAPPAEASIVVRRDDEWYSSSLQVGQDDLPLVLRDSAGAGEVALAWTATDAGPAIAVAVPLPAVDAQFFEVVVTSELARTLSALRVVLSVVALITAVGGALLGRWAAGRVLRPLDEVAGAAARIAGGSMDTRLEPTGDPDLATIVASFNSMVDAVEERIQRDARFAADVSHELRSPLTALVTSVEVLERRRGDLPERTRQALDLIRRDLDRFQRALEDLLELGRLGAGAAGLVFVTVDARDLVSRAAETVGVPAELVRDGSRRDDPPLVRVDKAAVHRALVNLLENAERHGAGVTGITLWQEPGAVLVAVDDAGPGVPPSERPRIFERFVRGGSRGSLPGSGLGLSLVAETVRAHGGAVWCTEPPVGPGARFVVRLPAADPGRSR
jgi:signal transduction histidine kinase